jgi:hypothetical protein
VNGSNIKRIIMIIKINELLLNNCKTEIGYHGEINPNKDSVVMLQRHAMRWIEGLNPTRLPRCPPPEKHPYSEFHPLNYTYTKFIIGTFPPISYFSNTFHNIRFFNGKIVSKPQLPFYHGNRQKLWQYLLGEVEFSNLSTNCGEQRRKEIISFLRRNEINYADIISYCQRLEYNSSDSNLFNIILNEQLLKIFDKPGPSEILLVFNTGSLFTNRGIKFSKNKKINPSTFAFDMFIYLLMEAGIEVLIQFKNQEPVLINVLNNKVLSQYRNILRFNLIINGISVNVVAGPSPSNRDGNLDKNKVFLRYKNLYHRDQNLAPGDLKKQFKHYVYWTALLGDPNELEKLNNE